MRPYVLNAEEKVNSLAMNYSFLTTFSDSVLINLSKNNLELALINSEKASAVSETIFDAEKEFRKQVSFFETLLKGLYSYEFEVPQPVRNLIKTIESLKVRHNSMAIKYGHKLLFAKKLLEKPNGRLNFGEDELDPIYQNLMASPMRRRYLADPGYARTIDAINGSSEQTTTLHSN